jgi:hypothetical protein
MVQRLTTCGIRTATAIRDRESFTTYGALSGRTVPDGGLGPGIAYNSWLNGDEKQQWYTDCYSIDYVVFSYATPIAWHTPNGWHVVAQKFSPTTGKHQSNLYMIR